MVLIFGIFLCFSFYFSDPPEFDRMMVVVVVGGGGGGGGGGWIVC
jgi:hypothetical protein